MGRTEPVEPNPDSVDEPIQMVLVSGFLGAGKTTALQTIAVKLSDRGYTVGMITNDQASGLVDTSILDTTAGRVVEIPGGCFCCNFTDLVTAAHSIGREDVDVLLAEPVGSCTDLVATVVNPLRSIHADEFDVAPLTVMVDPDRVRAYLDDEGQLPEEIQYIFRMQVEEADLIVLNKTDTLSDDETTRLVDELNERVGQRPVIPVSAEHGTGVDAWLTAVLNRIESDERFDTDRQETVAVRGRALVDIDYDIYAEGEAKLGWVNTTVELDGPFEVSQFRTALMDRLQHALHADEIEVAHLKFSISADGDLCHANLTATDGDPAYSGMDMGTVADGQLVLNIRAVGNPEQIRTIAETAIRGAATSARVDVDVERMQAFRPEYPEPVYRMNTESNAP
jgi:G3E family GTPase